MTILSVAVVQNKNLKGTRYIFEKIAKFTSNVQERGSKSIEAVDHENVSGNVRGHY